MSPLTKNHFSPIITSVPVSSPSPDEEPIDAQSFSFLHSPESLDCFLVDPDCEEGIMASEQIKIDPEEYAMSGARHEVSPPPQQNTAAVAAPFIMSQMPFQDVQDIVGGGGGGGQVNVNVNPPDYGQFAFQNYFMSTTPYAMSTPVAQHHFHPYRQYPSGLRPRTPGSHSPLRPLSPPLSTSQPGSARSHHQALGSSPPVGSLGSDTSQWGYSMAFGTPLTTASSLSHVSPVPLDPAVAMGLGIGVGVGMGSYPYPMHLASSANARASMMGVGGLAGAGGRKDRPMLRRNTTTAAMVKADPEAAEDDSDLDGEGEFDGEPSPNDRGIVKAAQGLGLEGNDVEERIPVISKREDIRKARIESEQGAGADKSKRRRDELREGFRRLKDALPHTTQRSSKSSLLDRAVAHIQAIEGANRYLLSQLDIANRDLENLRMTHTELIHTVANHSRGPSSPNAARPQ